MKRLLLIVQVFISAACFGQSGIEEGIGVRGYQLTPLGDSPYYLQNSPGGEVFYIAEIGYDEIIYGRMGISYVPFNLISDPAPIPGSENGQVFRGYRVQDQFSIFFASGGVEVSPEIVDKLKVYGGMDILFGGYSSQYEQTVRPVGETIQNNLLLGYRGRLGVSYSISKRLNVFAEGNYYYLAMLEIGFNPAADLGVGVVFWTNSNGKDG